VLVFHRINNQYDPFTEPIAPEAFRALLMQLKRRYTFAPLGQLIESPGRCKGCAFVTFDDATEDFHTHAWPVLSELKIPVTLFVPTKPVTHRDTIWNYRLFSYFLDWGEKGITIDWPGLRLKITSDNHVHSARILHNHLLSVSAASRMSLLNQIETLLPIANRKLAPLMSWEQLREVSRKGVTLGSHGWNHEYFPSLTSEEEIRKEFFESKSEIGDHAGVTPEYFAYPSGGFDDRSSRLLGEYYKAAFITGERMVRLKTMDARSIPRLNIYMSQPEENVLRTAGFHQLFRK
jgi:peptidoglycan/xylan/chitin deacetylase (PgdA/CDA1 family)